MKLPEHDLFQKRGKTGNRLERLFKEQKGKCFYCGHQMCRGGKGPRHATADHRQPLHSGGSNGYTNLVAVCRECNQLKGPLDEATFMQYRRDHGALAKHRKLAFEAIKKRRDEIQATLDRINRRGWE